jgi:hypothetical protein
MGHQYWHGYEDIQRITWGDIAKGDNAVWTYRSKLVRDGAEWHSQIRLNASTRKLLREIGAEKWRSGEKMKRCSKDCISRGLGVQ